MNDEFVIIGAGINGLTNIKIYDQGNIPNPTFAILSYALAGGIIGYICP